MDKICNARTLVTVLQYMNDSSVSLYYPWTGVGDVTVLGMCEFAGDNIYMLASTVSSKLLQSMASVEGFHFEETLTGFKWMGNRSHSLLKEGKKVLFAYEEAIGFMLGTAVLDKDGISAAAVMGELVSWLYDNGRTLEHLLSDVYLKWELICMFKLCFFVTFCLCHFSWYRYGRFLSDNSYYLCHSSSTIISLFESLRKDKKVYIYVYIPCIYLH